MSEIYAVLLRGASIETNAVSFFADEKVKRVTLNLLTAALNVTRKNLYFSWKCELTAVLARLVL